MADEEEDARAATATDPVGRELLLGRKLMWRIVQVIDEVAAEAGEELTDSVPRPASAQSGDSKQYSGLS